MKRGKVLEGVVVSDRCEKTVTVLVKNKTSHQLYKKGSLGRKKYKAHDKDNTAKIGDRVKIVESKPLSKEKKFKLLEIVNDLSSK